MIRRGIRFLYGTLWLLSFLHTASATVMFAKKHIPAILLGVIVSIFGLICAILYVNYFFVYPDYANTMAIGVYIGLSWDCNFSGGLDIFIIGLSESKKSDRIAKYRLLFSKIVNRRFITILFRNLAHIREISLGTKSRR